MTKQTHTPEPWMIAPTQSCEIISRLHGVIATPAPNLLLNKKDDAARIVACVNACEGIPNPAAIADVVAALEECVHIFEYAKNLQDDDSYNGQLKQARAALAALKGE